MSTRGFLSKMSGFSERTIANREYGSKNSNEQNRMKRLRIVKLEGPTCFAGFGEEVKIVKARGSLTPPLFWREAWEAQTAGRRCHGADTDEGCVEIGRKRVQEVVMNEA
jgi:hypothetical protein